MFERFYGLGGGAGAAPAGCPPTSSTRSWCAASWRVLVLPAPLLGGLSHLGGGRGAWLSSAPALGQAALTGLAIGLLLGEPLNAPYGGIFGFCLLSALGMVYVKRRSALPPTPSSASSWPSRWGSASACWWP